MWNQIFNIVISCLPPLYLATKAICPLCVEQFADLCSERVIDRFGLDELPPLLKTPRPHVSRIYSIFSKFSKILTYFHKDARALPSVLRVQGPGS
jgi:hypothetical protein